MSHERNVPDGGDDYSEFRSLFGDCEGFDEILDVRNNAPSYNFCLYSRDAEILEESAWERLGSYIAGNEHVRDLNFIRCGLDDSKAVALFSGLTSSTLTDVSLGHNEIGLSGIRSMAPFLKGSPNLTFLSFRENGNIHKQGFDLVLEALDGGAIECLNFTSCNIDNISALGRVNLPKLRSLYLADNKFTAIPVQALPNYAHLKILHLGENNIGEDAFHAIANLLREEDCSLTNLYVGSTGMGDAEAKNIAESLRCNNKLLSLGVTRNGLGPEGLTAFLKLLNDVSSMDRTGKSNHTLKYLDFDTGATLGDSSEKAKEIAKHIKVVLAINWDHRESPDKAGRDKVLKTLLDRKKRMALSRLQSIAHSSDHYLFLGIDPILLPNVLELAVQSGSRSELYQMLVAIAPDLVSIIDREAMLENEMAKNAERIAAIAAELATLNDANSRMKTQLISIRACGERDANNLSGNKRGRDASGI